MSKVKIKLVSIGHLPLEFQPVKITNWKSSTFELNGKIDNFALTCNSDGSHWEFSDKLVKEHLPITFDADFLIAIVNFPIENNWYTRRLGDNQVVFSYYEVRDILEESNIPIENAILRLLYSYTLLYRRANNTIPSSGIARKFTHDETKGCIFDMNGMKTDLRASCHKPQVCDECHVDLSRERVSKSDIENTKKEIKRIKKDLYYRILTNIKQHPILTLVLSSAFALTLGVIGSIIGSFSFARLMLLFS